MFRKPFEIPKTEGNGDPKKKRFVTTPFIIPKITAEFPWNSAVITPKMEAKCSHMFRKPFVTPKSKFQNHSVLLRPTYRVDQKSWRVEYKLLFPRK